MEIQHIYVDCESFTSTGEQPVCIYKKEVDRSGVTPKYPGNFIIGDSVLPTPGRGMIWAPTDHTELLRIPLYSYTTKEATEENLLATASVMTVQAINAVPEGYGIEKFILVYGTVYILADKNNEDEKYQLWTGYAFKVNKR